MPFYHYKEQLFFEITDVGTTRFEHATLPTKVGMRFNAKHKKTPLCRGVLCFVGSTIQSSTLLQVDLPAVLVF
jgi:hypothetical protein